MTESHPVPPRTSAIAPGRLPVVDGLRGVAILLVLAFHIRYFLIPSGNALWERVYHHVAGIGWIGVDLFFVLSGFLITGILIQSRERADYFRVFYARRTVRIFPLYYLSLALFFGLLPALLRMKHPEEVIRNLILPSSQVFAWTYVLNWRIGLASFSAVPKFIHHFWSLSIEEQFYLAWPLVIRTVAMRALGMVCALLIGLSLFSRMILHHLEYSTAAYVLTFCRLDGLAFGAIVALAIRDPRSWSVVRKGAPLLMALSLAGLGVMVVVMRSVHHDNFLMGTIGISLWGLFFSGFLVILLTAPEGSWLHRTASSRFLQAFGKYSYCLYICHQPLILALEQAGIHGESLTAAWNSKFLAVVALNAIVVLLVVGISMVSWHLFEKHFLKLKEMASLKHA